MSPFQAYKSWIALKRHFEGGSYDFIKYRGEIRVKEESFETRKDRIRFVQVARKKEPLQVMITTLLSNRKAWIGDAINKDEETEERLGRIQSLRYLVTSEIPLDPHELKSLMLDPKNLYSRNIKGKLSMESIAVTCGVVKPYDYWKKTSIDPLMEDFITKVSRYEPLIDYDRKSFADFFLKKILE